MAHNQNGGGAQFGVPKIPVHILFAQSYAAAPAAIPEVIIDNLNEKSYSRLTFLGQGAFGKCYEVEDRVSKQRFACKILRKSSLSTPSHREKMAEEIRIHRELSHEFIVKFISYFQDDLNVYILLELCTKKTLSELQRRRRLLSETEVRYYLRQILMAVDYLHRSKIIHRDLKLGNIFISENMKLKIGDFGLSIVLELGNRAKGRCGTTNYMAPEIYGSNGYSFQADIWSVGCIVYCLLFGRLPFDMFVTHSPPSGIVNFPSIPISAGMKSLIQKMLVADPNQRPSANKVLSGTYLATSFIPQAMPVSALTLPPRFDDEAKHSIALKRRHNKKYHIPLKSSIALTHKQNADTIANHMKNLLKQLQTVLATKPTEKKCRSNSHAEDPNCAPMLWIAKWVDYSDKYGFGYQLSDDSIGASFNDKTKMILLADGNNLHYIDKVGNEFYHTKKEYPVKISSKVKLLDYFQQYMSEHLVKAGGNVCTPEMAAMTRLPCMSTWTRTSRALTMVLSNGTLQMNNLKDHIKTIFCPLMQAVTMLDKDKPMRTYKFSTIESQGCCKNLSQKIADAVEKLESILVCMENNKPNNKVEIKENEKVANPIAKGKGPN